MSVGRSLAAKLIVPLVIIVLVSIGSIMTWLVQQQQQQVVEEQVSRLRTIAQQMDNTRDYMASIQQEGTYQSLDTVPIVVALRVGALQAERAQDGLVVRTPTDKPRNPANQGDPWELEQLARFQADPGLTEVQEVTEVNGTSVLRYAMPVKVTEDCLVCHGFPVGEKDPFGYVKEGYQVGDIRALYSLYLPTAAVEAQTRRNLLTLYGVGVAVIVAIILALIWLTRRTVSRPLSNITAQLQDINAGQGDLTRRLQVDSADEVGRLAVQFNTFIDNLGTMIRDLEAIAHHVATVSSDVAEAANQTGLATQDVAINIEQLAQQASNQADQVAAVREETDRLATAAAEVAQNAREAAAASRSSAASARHGQDVLQTVVQGMEEIAATVGEAGQTVKALGQRSTEITQILDMIQDFARQTNLLALNAAIEAARAGEAGKGFSVVAEEVRRLAEESATAASRISEMVIQIQEGTWAAVDAMTQGQAKTSEGVELISEARGALEQIVAAAQETDSQIQAISQATGRLAASNQQVSANMEELSRAAAEISSRATNIGAAAEEQTAAVEEISASTTNLAGDAEKLDRMVKRFRY